MIPTVALFDFDGVVMDTESQYSIFWDEQGRRYHPEIPNFDRLIKGQTLVQLFGKYFAEMNVIQEQIRKDLYCYEEQMTYEYLPGIEDFIEDLHINGVKIAVVTSSDDTKMQNVYRVHPDMKQKFDRIITSNDFTLSKPEPECFLLGAEIFGSNAENSFVFEDSFHGLEAGRRAGMTVIGLSTTNSRDTIIDKAALVIPDFRGFTFAKMMELKGYS